MFVHLVAALTIASTVIAQTPVPNSQAEPPAAQNPAALSGQIPPSASTQTITVPTGTAIPLTLMSSIKSKSTKPGDSVRAVIAFPVTIGSRLAIPVGTFAEGVVNQVTPRPGAGQQPSFRVHFTRLVFANGYSVALNGENTQALALPPNDRARPIEVAELAPINFPGAHFVMGEGQQLQLPPLPQNGPSPAVLAGIGFGSMAAIGIGTLLWMHHRANSFDYVLFDSGWQFQMILDAPVVLDAAQVAAAAAMSTSPAVN